MAILYQENWRNLKQFKKEIIVNAIVGTTQKLNTGSVQIDIVNVL